MLASFISTQLDHNETLLTRLEIAKSKCPVVQSQVSRQSTLFFRSLFFKRPIIVNNKETKAIQGLACDKD